MSNVRRFDQIPRITSPVSLIDETIVWQGGRTRSASLADLLGGPISDAVDLAFENAPAAPNLTVKGNVAGAVAKVVDVPLATLAAPGNPLGDAIAAKAVSISRALIPSLAIQNTSFVTDEGARYKRVASGVGGVWPVQDFGGQWWDLDLSCGFCDIRWTGAVPIIPGNVIGSTPNAAAIERAYATGRPYFPDGLEFYVERPTRAPAGDFFLSGTGTMWFNAPASGINANGSLFLAAGATPLVLGGTALSAFGLTPGTYASGTTGTALNAAIYTDEQTQASVSAGVATALSPLNSIYPALPAGWTFTVNGTTITVVGSNAAGNTEVNVNDPLWLLADKIDTASGGGSFLSMKQTSAGAVVRIGAEGRPIRVSSCCQTGPAGRLFDISFPEVASAYARMAYVYADALAASTAAPFPATWKNCLKISGAWAPVIDISWSSWPVEGLTRKDGSYGIHLAGGNYGAVGPFINGLYYYGQYGLVATGYVETLRIGDHCEFVGQTTPMFMGRNARKGGFAGIYSGESWWLGTGHFNGWQAGIDISGVQHVYGTPNASNKGSSTNFVGCNLYGGANHNIWDMQTLGAGAALVLSNTASARVSYSSENATTGHVIDAACTNCFVEAHNRGTTPGSINSSPTSVDVVFSGNVYRIGGASSKKQIDGPVSLGRFATFAALNAFPKSSALNGAIANCDDRNSNAPMYYNSGLNAWAYVYNNTAVT